MVQDTSRAPPDAVQAALEALPRLSDSMNIDLVPDCVHNLKKKRSGLQALKLLHEIVNRTPKARRVEAAEALLIDKDVIFSSKGKSEVNTELSVKRKGVGNGVKVVLKVPEMAFVANLSYNLSDGNYVTLEATDEGLKNSQLKLK